MEYLTFILAIIIAIGCLIGLIYLWDHFVSKDMKAVTIVLLSLLTIAVLTGAVFLCIYAFNVHNITDVWQDIINLFSGGKPAIEQTVQNDSTAITDTIGIDSI